MKSIDPIVYLNGRFLRARRARINPFDRGFLHADSLFETWRTYSGIPFALALHLERLADSARRLEIPLQETDWDLVGRRLLRRNGVENGDAAIRLTVTRGAGGDGLLPPTHPRPTVLLTCRPLDSRLSRLRRSGVRVAIVPFSAGTGGLLDGVKTTDYLTAIIAKARARRQRAFEGIYSTKAGEILEGGTSNVFLVKQGRLFTPALGRGVLPGVTRSLVMEIARRCQIAVGERRLSVDRLRQADEAFLTATTMEILPIHSLVPPLTRFAVGPITRRLQSQYALLVRHAISSGMALRAVS